MGNMEALYNTWKAIGVSGGDLSFFQDFFVKFYQAFIEADRWLQYLNGVKTTLLVTALALILGVALGVTVAILRTAHDQQRPGHRNPVLAVLNLVCKIYVTVIRGTPMMVQLLIMGFVIFASSRNFTMIGTLTLGINSGAYVSEIVRGGLMSVDKGQMEAGRSLGLGYGIGANPAVLAGAPQMVSLIFGGSGIVAAAAMAIILNIVLPKDKEITQSDADV